MGLSIKAGLAIGISVLGLAGGTGAFATDTVIEIDPGLYAYHSTLLLGQQKVLDEQYEYCLTEDLTKRSLGEIVAELHDGGNCSVSNVQHRLGYGEADVVCQNPDIGTARGTLKADYTRQSYSIRANATMGAGVPMASKVNARRIGDCPPGWTPPPGISHK